MIATLERARSLARMFHDLRLIATLDSGDAAQGEDFRMAAEVVERLVSEFEVMRKAHGCKGTCLERARAAGELKK